jgi:hypothetical protein
MFLQLKTRTGLISRSTLKLAKIGLCITALCFAGSSGILLWVKLQQADTFSPGPGRVVRSGISKPYDMRRFLADARTLRALVRYLLEPEPEPGAGGAGVLTSNKPAVVGADTSPALAQGPPRDSNHLNLGVKRPG